MREFKFLYAFGLITIIAASLSACAQGQSAKTANISSPLPVRETFSGSYLSGRFAQQAQDWNAAQNFMSNVLVYDRNNDLMIQRTFLLALGSGNVTKAKELAGKITTAADNDDLALILLSCDAIGRDDFTGALSLLEKLPAEGFGQYTKPLLTAWSLMGLGKKADALKILAESASPDDPAYRMHAGMMEELDGNMNAAAKHYKSVMENGLNLHTAIMIGNFYERYGRPELTQGIYEGLGKIYPFSPFVGAMSSRDPHRTIAPNIRRPADGAALALFDLATLLYEKRAYDSAQIYGSMAQMLAPNSPFAMLLMGDIAALHNQYDQALADYDAIDPQSPIYWLGRTRIAEIYEINGRMDEAVGVLTGLSEEPSMHLQALVSLGDVYRRHNMFENAIDAYNKALDGVSPVTEDHWSIIYARGMSEERLNRWDRAEKDLLQALKFQPNNPTVLNFIAYSWANQGVNLDKALEYVQHAAALRPNDGYILDSYGWTLFRLNRYQESVSWLEQAIEQIPNDSTLLDHLGDAYWQVGRHNEARHQWRHAQDLSQDSSFKTLVQQKLSTGIAAPRQVAGTEAAF